MILTVKNIQIEGETELSMDIGQKPLKVLKKHGITLRGQEKRMLTHVPYASGENLFYKNVKTRKGKKYE